VLNVVSEGVAFYYLRYSIAEDPFMDIMDGGDFLRRGDSRLNCQLSRNFSRDQRRISY